jgi:hypothetical protein
MNTDLLGTAEAHLPPNPVITGGSDILYEYLTKSKLVRDNGNFMA